MQLNEHLAVVNERCILALRFYLLYICDVGVHVAEINVLIVLSIIVCVCCTEMRLRCVTALVVACLLATAAAQDQAGKSGLRLTDLFFPVWFPAFVLPQRLNYSRDANRALADPQAPVDPSQVPADPQQQAAPALPPVQACLFCLFRSSFCVSSFLTLAFV